MEENNLPDGWVWTTIGEVAETTSGGTPSRNHPQYYNGTIPWVKSGELEDSIILDAEELLTDEGVKNSSAKIFRAGTVLVAMYGATVGKTGILGLDATTNQAICGISPLKNAFTAKFMMYWLQSQRQKLIDQSAGGAQPNINQGIVRAFSFPLAPLPEQQRVVAAIEQQFTRLDAGVAALKSAQTRLKRYRAAVLKAAVEGKLTETWRVEHPTSELASQLLARILQERRAKWEADLRAKGKDPAKVKYVEPAAPDVSGLPELPEGWCWTSFGQCIEVHVGATPSRKERSYWKGNIPWVSSGEVQFCRIRETREYITQAGLDNSSTQINPAGSVLLGMIGEGRTRGQVAMLDIDACNNQNCAALWVSQVRIIPEYIYYWLWSQYEVTRQGSSGNNQPALNKVRIEQMLFPLLPISEQQQIVSEVERRLSIVSQLEVLVEANLKRAERLRQSVLREAFAGRLVPQDPDDEPASVLLERIRQEREAAGNENKGRKQGKQQPTYSNTHGLHEHETFQEVYARNRSAQEPEPLDESEIAQVALWNAD